jgi:hypothetical protein
MILPDGRENSRQASEKRSPIGENVSYLSILGSIGKPSRQRKILGSKYRRQRIGSGIREGIHFAYFSYKTRLGIDIIIPNRYISEVVGSCKV